MPNNERRASEWLKGFGEGVIEARKILANEEFEQAEDKVDRWLKGRLEGQSYMAKELCPLIEQLCRDLNEAHNEILRQQGIPESDWGKFDWPEWTNQANSIRWAEKILKKKLAKTDYWTLYPCSAPLLAEGRLNDEL